MWIETDIKQLINTDKLVAIQGGCDDLGAGIKMFYIYGLYTPGIRYCRSELELSKDSIRILNISSEKDIQKIEYIYKNIFEKLKSSFSFKEKFMSVPKMIEKYSLNFKA